MVTSDPLRIARAHLLLRRIVSDHDNLRSGSRTSTFYEDEAQRRMIIEVAYLLLDDHPEPLPFLPAPETVSADMPG